jgi:hypothetical protein
MAPPQPSGSGTGEDKEAEARRESIEKNKYNNLEREDRKRNRNKRKCEQINSEGKKKRAQHAKSNAEVTSDTSPSGEDKEEPAADDETQEPNVQNMELDSTHADETVAKSNAEVTSDTSPSGEDKEEPADDDEAQEPNVQNMRPDSTPADETVAKSNAEVTSDTSPSGEDKEEPADDDETQEPNVQNMQLDSTHADSPSREDKEEPADDDETQEPNVQNMELDSTPADETVAKSNAEVTSDTSPSGEDKEEPAADDETQEPNVQNMQPDSTPADETVAKSNAEVTSDTSPSREDKEEPADDDETQEPNVQNMQLDSTHADSPSGEDKEEPAADDETQEPNVQNMQLDSTPADETVAKSNAEVTSDTSPSGEDKEEPAADDETQEPNVQNMQPDSTPADETVAKSNAEVTSDTSPSGEDKEEPADDDETQEPNVQNMQLDSTHADSPSREDKEEPAEDDETQEPNVQNMELDSTPADETEAKSIAEVTSDTSPSGEDEEELADDDETQEPNVQNNPRRVQPPRLARGQKKNAATPSRTTRSTNNSGLEAQEPKVQNNVHNKKKAAQDRRGKKGETARSNRSTDNMGLTIGNPKDDAEAQVEVKIGKHKNAPEVQMQKWRGPHKSPISDEAQKIAEQARGFESLHFMDYVGIPFHLVTEPAPFPRRQEDKSYNTCLSINDDISILDSRSQVMSMHKILGFRRNTVILRGMEGNKVEACDLRRTDFYPIVRVKRGKRGMCDIPCRQRIYVLRDAHFTKEQMDEADLEEASAVAKLNKLPPPDMEYADFVRTNFFKKKEIPIHLMPLPGTDTTFVPLNTLPFTPQQKLDYYTSKQARYDAHASKGKGDEEVICPFDGCGEKIRVGPNFTSWEKLSELSPYFKDLVEKHCNFHHPGQVVFGCISPNIEAKGLKDISVLMFAQRHLSEVVSPDNSERVTQWQTMAYLQRKSQTSCSLLSASSTNETDQIIQEQYEPASLKYTLVSIFGKARNAVLKSTYIQTKIFKKEKMAEVSALLKKHRPPLSQDEDAVLVGTEDYVEFVIKKSIESMKTAADTLLSHLSWLFVDFDYRNLKTKPFDLANMLNLFFRRGFFFEKPFPPIAHYELPNYNFLDLVVHKEIQWAALKALKEDRESKKLKEERKKKKKSKKTSGDTIVKQEEKLDTSTV